MRSRFSFADADEIFRRAFGGRDPFEISLEVMMTSLVEITGEVKTKIITKINSD